MPGHGPSRAGHRPTDRARIESTSESPTRQRRTAIAPRTRQGLGAPTSLRPDDVERRHRKHEERCGLHPSRSSPSQLWSEVAMVGRSMPGHGPSRAGHRPRQGLGAPLSLRPDDVERRHRQHEERCGRRFFRIRKKIRANRYFRLSMAVVGNLVFDRENVL
jgi:hypothetical protein